ncbi:hypothetical protein DBV05_g12749 [Lasiodiplodia theobromae]|uniref:Uncharacterized protein n=1 Tax=Lasiodiplodia theobromae TaxID=45133 RepID=A0A5N5CTD2_9PEZI|nr:hypothetical protein DBV05_g12749 [Lasiodiplodia theobromae]
MRQTAKNAWISLKTDRDDWVVIDHGGLEHCKSVGKLSQYPRTVLFIGREAKRKARRATFPFNNHNKREKDSFVNLVRDSLISECERPILFSELNLIYPPNPKTGLPDGCKKYRLEWANGAEQRSAANEVYDALIAKVVLQFYDVVCLFADDFKNHEQVALHVMRWVQKAHRSTMLNRPRLVVFSSSPFTLDQFPGCSSLFSNIRTSTHAQSSELSYTAQYLRLRDTILTELDVMQKAKTGSRILFETRHLTALTDKALEHFSAATSLDLAKAAKEFNPVGPGFASHLEELIRVQKAQITSPPV